MNAEQTRLDENRRAAKHWRRWGPYLSERQWGTVREDYSATGEAWDYFPHDHARSRAYRWGEDGILGVSDNHQRLCFALALWNERDPILKERLFGLTGQEGNHGEDVKECYYYLDSTPTHSWMRGLYKYPQATFPYGELVGENRRRKSDLRQPEYELLDTGAFAEGRYFDVFVEYAKADDDDLLIRLSAVNRGPDPAPLHLLPTLWFRNTWAFADDEDPANRPTLSLVAGNENGAVADDPAGPAVTTLRATHDTLGEMHLLAPSPGETLFTENATNSTRLWGTPSAEPFQKDGIGRCVVNGERDAVNPAGAGTKAALHYAKMLEPGETWTLSLRLCRPQLSADGGSRGPADLITTGFDRDFDLRRREADEFYADLAPAALTPEQRLVQRQAFAGMLWNKQFYHYVVDRWLDGDPGQPTPPAARRNGRNHDWRHLFNDDILSMPDTWEFPWFAAWDTAFHTVPLALVDPEFAKRQLVLLTREWYMHPNGQLPAYEWAFGDVNPPVHAWAAWRVYTIERRLKGGGRGKGGGDLEFLERVFQKLLLNFTWWVNRKDAQDRNIFQGGFLGLDNIGVFDRSQPLPTGGYLEQSDGTSWMAMYALNLLRIALELAPTKPAYEDIASKFFEHFLAIATAMSRAPKHRAGVADDGGGDGGEGSLWNEEDGLFYDRIHLPDGTHVALKVHSMVSLIPLFAVETIDAEILERLPGFARRYRWFMDHRPNLTGNVSQPCRDQEQRSGRLMLSIVGERKLRRILAKVLDEEEFLGPFGIRSVSKFHERNPYVLPLGGGEHRVDYNPGESQTHLFGGNSNWRGPVWFPVNYLLIESLQKFHRYLGDGFTVECPARSGRFLNLWQVAAELSRRLERIFLPDPGTGQRPVFGGQETMQRDPHWRDAVLFHEYFHAETGQGLGASHQTGWTGLIAKLIQQTGDYPEG